MGLVTTGFRGLLRVFEEVAERVEHELDNEDALKAELTELYSKLEDGRISE